MVAANSFQTLTVRVPNEKDEPTIKVRVEFPAGLIVSRFQPKSGWQREVAKDAQGRITAATWSGGQIGDSEYEEFAFLARTPKEPGKLLFKAYQTYQSGETVGWIGDEGTENEAPFIEVTDAPTTGEGAPSVEQGSATQGVGSVATASTTAAEGTAPTTQPPSDVATVVAVAAGQATISAEPTADVNPAMTNQSDAPLFAMLGALAVSITALIVAGIALFRRS